MVPARLQSRRGGGGQHFKPHRGKDMSIIPQYEIKISGVPIAGKNMLTFIKTVDSRIKKIDPASISDSRNFAGIKYTFTWQGDLKDFTYIDNVKNSIVTYANRYLKNWVLSIKINYIEHEEKP